MQFSAAQIAQLINGKTEGDTDKKVGGFAKIEEAKSGDLAFLANPKYEEYLYTTGADVIIINDAQELKKPVAATLIRVPDAYLAFATLLDHYQKMQASRMTGIQEPVFIHSTVKKPDDVFIGAFSYLGAGVTLGSNVKIYPLVYVGDGVRIGDNTTLHPGVKVYHGCVIGNNVTVHSGTVIGGDGFGFAPQADGSFRKVPQTGNVVVEDDVEIGSNTAIDRATIGSTIIRRGAKLDNLLQIAHNVEIGENSVIAAQSGISGSTKLGKNVMVGGQAGIVGHLQIAEGSKINAQSGVSKSIKVPGSAVTGSPAYDYTSALRSQALSRKLPDIEKKIKALEEEIRKLKG